MGLKPEKILSNEAIEMPHSTVIAFSPQLSEQEQIDIVESTNAKNKTGHSC
jgi:hypothetical protein